MRQMTEEEWIAFLRQGTRTAKLSINLPRRRPTVTPVWFLYGDDNIVRIETGAASAKARALAVDPRACLVVDLEEAPYAFVKIDATGAIVDDPELTLRVATEIGRRYMGETPPTSTANATEAPDRSRSSSPPHGPRPSMTSATDPESERDDAWSP